MDGQQASGPVDAGAFRAGMARIPGAVHVITTDGPGGRSGLTATAVCSVTAEPPTLLFCVNEGSSAAPAFLANAAVTVNAIGPDLQGVAAAFGGKIPMDERFGTADWVAGDTGAWRLPGAPVAFDCVVTGGMTVGTHRVMLAEVRAVHLHGGTVETALWFDRGFRALAPAG